MFAKLLLKPFSLIVVLSSVTLKFKCSILIFLSLTTMACIGNISVPSAVHLKSIILYLLFVIIVISPEPGII